MKVVCINFIEYLPVSDMVTVTLSTLQVESLLKCADFIIEKKFDGERMQLHMKDGEYRYFSRKYVHVCAGFPSIKK